MDAMSEKKKAFLVAVLLAAASAGVALGCGWEGIENSVRFGYGLTDRERSRLPPLPFKTGGARDKEKTNARSEVDADLPSKQDAANVDKLWDEADAAVDAGDLRKAQKLLGEYVAHTAPADWHGSWETPTEYRSRRNSAFDRLDALDALDRGSGAENVARYLAARKAYDEWPVGPVVKEEESETQSNASAAQEQPQEQQQEQPHHAAQDVTSDTPNGQGAAVMRTWDRDVEANLSAPARDANLADNAAYLRAVGVARVGERGDAVEAFEAVAAKHPRSEKRDDALYMVGRLSMASSKSYAGGDTATSDDPCRDPDCRDEAWQRARRSFARLASEYPRGRLAADARGWLAYLDMRVGDKAGALVEYYRLLGGACGDEGRDLALRSLRLVRHRADVDDIARVETELEDEPEAALAYAYHNVYNYTYSYYLALPETEDDDNSSASGEYSLEQARSDEQEETKRRERAERAELRRVAAFAARMLQRYPRAGVGAAFAVRVAAANLELGDARAALDAARRALASSPDAAERAKALWIKGAAEYRLKTYDAARKTLTQLADDYPDGDLVEGARRMLATLAEDAGDLGGALEQYLALGYDADAGYFVDVLMTPEQLAAFVAAHEDSPRRDELLYALGLRHMRAGRYPAARAAFARVRTRTDSDSMASSVYGYYDYDEENPHKHPKLNIRHSFWDYDFDGDATAPDAVAADPSRDSRVYADWLLKDTQTLDRLERLQAAIDCAADDEAKAEATYQLASYFYEGTLITYNPAAWRGARATMLGTLDEAQYRSPNEAHTVWRHAQEHEAASRALSLYLDVVRLYPRTRAARDALYTAMLCHDRLSNYNGYWRARYEQGLHAGERMVTLADLRRAYPDYRLPFDGHWEPSTRTVGGDPAWPAPPKPRKLTGMERARLKLERAELRASQAWELFGEVAGGRARHYTLAAVRWSLVLIISITTLLIFRLTRRSRAVLFDLLARLSERRAPTVELLPAHSSSYGAHEPYTQAARARAAARDLWRGLFRIILDERGRAALALNLLTHGLLTALLYALMWAIRTG